MLLWPSTFIPAVSDRTGEEQGHLNEFFLFFLTREESFFLFYDVQPAAGCVFLVPLCAVPVVRRCEICSNVSLTIITLLFWGLDGEKL